MIEGIIHGDALTILRTLPDESVHCVVTSPPYWGLRDYGTGTYEGGDPECDHKQTVARHDGGRVNIDGFHGPASVDSDKGAMNYRDICGKCGARRVDKQLGLEATPEEYVARMTEVFREVRRVLRSDGTLWLNMGDSWSAGTTADRKPSSVDGYGKHGYWTNPAIVKRCNAPLLKAKDMIGMPWRLAFALQADGWYLRSDIIWHKKNPMPESVTDRPTKAHEYLFLLSKSARYFYDQEAIRGRRMIENVAQARANGADHDAPFGNTRNKRSVWTIATQAMPGAHFATFPEKLVEPCIRAGTSERGVCPDCGAPWVRVVEKEQRPRGDRFGQKDVGDHDHGQAGSPYMETISSSTTGWRPSCECYDDRYRAEFARSGNARKRQQQDAARRWFARARKRPGHDWPTDPAIVLEPFCGAATTPLVAKKFGRDFVAIELKQEYIEISNRRLDEVALWL